ENRAILLEVVVTEEELRLVYPIGGIVDAADVERPDVAALRLEDGPLQRHAVADLPPKPLREVAPDDGTLAVVEPGLHLFGRQLVLRVDFQEWIGVDRDIGEEVRRILVDAVEPGV